MSSFVGILRNILRTVCVVVEAMKEKIHSIFFLRFKLPCSNSDAPNTMLALNACTSVYKTALKVLANEKTLCIKNGPLMHAFILGEEVEVSF